MGHCFIVVFFNFGKIGRGKGLYTDGEEPSRLWRNLLYYLDFSQQRSLGVARVRELAELSESSKKQVVWLSRPWLLAQ